ncbi:MAG: nucleotidyltransferase domain-containing protein [Patescibacteria group bacterium]|nr:nucleotidyltransferase domain-containing protein [Patescibacteria group bacterium]
MKQISRRKLLDQIVERYRDDKNVKAVLIGGSMARGEENVFSDFDIILIVKEKTNYVRFHTQDVFIEVDSITLVEVRQRLKATPEVYFSLTESKALWDPEGLHRRILELLKAFHESYKVAELTKADLFIKSVNSCNKLAAALESRDDFLIAYHTALALNVFYPAVFALADEIAPPMTHAWKFISGSPATPVEYTRFRRALGAGRVGDSGKLMLKMMKGLSGQLEPSIHRFKKFYKEWRV